MSTLMILGGSQCQKNALIAARRMGYRTILADYLEHPPAAALADLHCRISTFDVGACLEAARRHRVDGIFTIGTDQPVYTAAQVAKALGLPSLIGADTALAVTNKLVMKPILTAHGIPTARYRFIAMDSPPDALCGLRPPYVLKPADSQGQRGVFKLPDTDAVFTALPEALSFSRQKEALTEEYYPSDELTLSAWVREGRLYPLALTDRLHYDDPVHIGVCVGHRFPTVHTECLDDALALSRRIVEAFGIQNGPLYVQFLIGAEGLLVNELACRIGGAFEDVFIPWLCGFDILQAVIQGALGQAIKPPPADWRMETTPRQVFVSLMFARPGRIAQMTPAEALKALPFVLDAGYNYTAGQVLPAVQNATARLGHCVMVSADGRIDRCLQDFNRTLSVRDAEGRELALPVFSAPKHTGAQSETR